jgi:competence protein ComEC
MSGGAAWTESPGGRPEAGWARAVRTAGQWALLQLAEERERWPLWGPVLFATGIAIYFALPAEPAWWAGPLALGALLVAACGLRRQQVAALVLLAAAACAAGLTVAQVRAHYVAAPVLERRHGPSEIEGRIISVEIRADGTRIVLDRLSIEGVPDARAPATVRIRMREDGGARAGDRIAVKAVLQPPPPPAAPGAYDFQRQAWFDRLGAVGYAIGDVRVLRAGAESADWRIWVNGLRQRVVERVLTIIPGPEGAIAAALLTGEQGQVPAEVMNWMRDSGLAHLLSVSGLHVSLVAAIVFVAIRQTLALIPPVALYHPIKKWAAVGAFIAITLYMLFVAPGVPTQRAWLMASVVLLAILIDRSALSMRLVAWAALAVLAVSPESLLHPSFQMSFAAVVALIAAWEAARRRFTEWRAGSGLPRRLLIGAVGLCMTSLVATLATTPYALYHFNRFAAYGLIANLIAVPLTGAWVMPCAVLVFLLMPFGLESWALIAMGWGCEAIVAVAREVAQWEGGAGLWPAMPVWGLALATVGGTWLCLWQRGWRLAGVPVIVLGVASPSLVRGPDILISADARLVAVRGADGQLHFSSGRAARIARETWLRRDGQEDRPSVWPRHGRSADGLLNCDDAGCLYRARGHVVALVKHASALAEDCRHADVLIATIPVRRRCPAASLVIDRFSLWREGGHAVWLDPGTVRTESVRDSRGERPWVPSVPTARNRRELTADRHSGAAVPDDRMR